MREINHSRETRRTFLGKTLAGVGGASSLFGYANAQEVIAQAGEDPKAEKLVKELLGSLREEQRGKIVLPFSDPRRRKIDNNWNIVEETIGGHFDKNQQLLIRDIFRELHSEQLREEVWRQFLEDNRGKNAKTPDEIFGTASIAIFEEPESKKFEFVLTGRHVTRRCDGNSSEGVAFGGPVFYGHASKSFNESPKHEGNAYWYQAKRANALYEMLDGKQRGKALKDHSRGERGTSTVALAGKKEGLEGLPVWEMTSDQRDLIMEVVSDLLLPFRESDRIEAASMINEQISNTHIAFYKNEDVGDDGVWDTWQLEGPSLVWYFRGKPHVHVWVHVKEPEAEKKA
jgi:Protein of unknown function (DUF3500)